MLRHDWAYLKYVIKHKWFVFRACRVLGVPLWQSLFHDLSKFSRVEWRAYVNYFHARKDEFVRGRLDPTKTSDDFAQAWNHHQKANPHHWEYWVLGTGKPIPMPERYVREMLADWMGAGRAKTGRYDLDEWVVANAGSMNLHPKTADRVHDILNLELGYHRAAGAIFTTHCQPEGVCP